jgi:hypothetical protein
VAEGDGTSAIIGTGALAEKFGLQEIATGIDGSAVSGNWWAISAIPLLDPSPTLLIVTGRFSGDGQLGDTVTLLQRAGFTLLTMSAKVTGQELFQSDCVLRFGGKGTLQSVQTALKPATHVRLAGAIRTPS